MLGNLYEKALTRHPENVERRNFVVTIDIDDDADGHLWMVDEGGEEGEK